MGFLLRSLALTVLLFGTAGIAIRAQNQPSFEVVVIKPSKPDTANRGWDSSIDQMSIRAYTLRRIIRAAYGLKSDSQVVGGPKWIDTECFDITAKVDDAEVAKIRGMSPKDASKENQLMLRSLLADRFQLKVGRVVRSIPVYELVLAQSTFRSIKSLALKKTDNHDSAGSGESKEHSHSLSAHNGHMTAIGISMDALAEDLAEMRETDNRVVLNRTALTGDYDFRLDWTQDRGEGIAADAPYPGLFTALQEQLGLQLKSQKAPVEVIVVDAATEPVPD